jgi:hypothetical protein
MMSGCWLMRRPWTIVEGTDRRYTQLKIFDTLTASLESQLTLMDLLPEPASWADNEEDEED